MSMLREEREKFKHLEMRWYNPVSAQILNNGYLLAGETVDDAIDRVANAAERWLGIKGFADDLRFMVRVGWMSLSSPIWANMGTKRGLPISCFNVHVADSMESIADKAAEVMMQAKNGGGTSGYFGALRGRGASIAHHGRSSGAVTHLRLFDTLTTTTSQADLRPGRFAAYLDIDHPDIQEFLHIRHHDHPIQNLYSGVCVSDAWFKAMHEGDVAKRETWAAVLRSRRKTGMPYVFFKDNVKRGMPEVYKDQDAQINASNLCTEILLPSTEDESFICCLSSMNLLHFDEWKGTKAVQVAIYFLDAVLDEFIHKTEGNKHLAPARKFAERHRAVGLGALGWHSFLQANDVPFESMKAKWLTTDVFKEIREQAVQASKNLADRRGEPEVLQGYGLRNTTLMAIAPTATSSDILGQASEGIEPLSSNYFVREGNAGNFTYKNPALKKVLSEVYDKDDAETWESIMRKDGSVQHLDFLSQHHKDVFKTFFELSQYEIILQASMRQKYIDQGQSLNLAIPPQMAPSDIQKLMVAAWELGIKTLYYQRGKSVAKEQLASLTECTSCSG